jgi:two-component system, NtrC family, sensor histidine kinase HydH
VLLQRIRSHTPGLRVAIIGDSGRVADAVAAMRAQAFDYLEEPISPEALAALIRRARSTPDAGQTALLDSLQTLVPGLVHELRNPLSGILAGSQMLTRLVRGAGTASEYAGIIYAEALRLERLLARLAEFGKLRAHGLQCKATVDLADLLQRVLDAATPACTVRRIQIARLFDPEASVLSGDPGRLAQACAEIVQNAQEAMPEGGSLRVSSRCAPGIDGSGDGWIEVEFHDTGPALTEEVRRRAFEPFFSTRPRALGVGLSLVQAIVSAHGGSARLEPAADAGSRVVLQLPAKRRCGEAPTVDGRESTTNGQ